MANSTQVRDPSLRRSAFVLNGGPMIGILGAGIYGRLNPEFHFHRPGGYEGHAFNLGLAIVLWPNEGGPAFSLSARYQYDQQLVAGTRFFVSPYVGLEAGMGIFNVLNGGEVRASIVAAPNAGVEVKLLVGDALILGFRPLGVIVQMFIIGSPPLRVDVLYDIGLTIGARY